MFDMASMFFGASDSAISLKSTGATALFTNQNANKQFFPILAVVLTTSVTGVLTVSPTISIGTNSSSFNNILNSQLINNFASGDSGLVTYVLLTKAAPVASGTQISLNVNIGATTTGNYSARVGLIGIFR